MSEYSSPTQFIDLVRQQQKIKPQLIEAINRVLDHGQFIMGPEVKDFEDKLCNFTGSTHALTCANGTDAITIALMTWNVGPGDAVFVPSFTYVASAEAPAQLGATPFFVDVLEDTFNLDPDSFKQAILDCRKFGLNPSVVIAVDLFGQPADLDEITKIAHEENIKVLVDGAQSFGATFNGRKVGLMGDATTTSFFPAKPLGCYGDGGAIFTNNDEDAELINSIRLHGKGSQKYDNIRVGLNSRLDTLQAAILIEKLKIFPNELLMRHEVASFYTELLSKILTVPKLAQGCTSSWAQYTIQAEARDLLQTNLKLIGIPSVVYYPIPLSKQIGYRDYPCVSSGLEVSELLSNKVLSLPMHPYLLKPEQNDIALKIGDILKEIS
jgi:dTDP-4-amino-4,6-dideoxygalactose transaminase